MTVVLPTAQVGNPFPGLRPFEPEEATLFFGREEQCDQLLARLAQRRMVVVVGASGSGKSSLVRAGLIPALESGYLPSAGTSWKIAVCRPGANPIDNLAASLIAHRGDERAGPTPSIGETRSLLDFSSLGLAECALRLVAGSASRLLVIVDQFEEIFRFSREGGPSADDVAAAFVSLILAAAGAQDAPVYVVLTMRSDYLGDCGRFVGMPEALNDSQFLVPQMTRDHVKEAIRGPTAVRGAQLTGRLVQRLLHDFDQLTIAGRRGRRTEAADPLPLLQHALMRMWDAASEARAADQPIDLAHYEQAPVCTISQALNLHAEEAFAELDADGQHIAERVFRRLTERDLENRDIRRPTALLELASVGLAVETATEAECEQVRLLLGRFARPGRSFLVFDRLGVVDISHESLIRQWKRLATWVEREATSKRIFTTLSAWADGWAHGARSLYRGPELVEALAWVRAERPTETWADRYGGDLANALKYLSRSRQARLLRRVVMATAALAVAILTGLYVLSQRQAARSSASLAELRSREADLLRQAEDARASGRTEAAARLRAEAEAARLRADTQVRSFSPPAKDVNPGDTAELALLRRELDQALARAKVAEDALARASAPQGANTDRTELQTRIESLQQQLAQSNTERDSLRARVDAQTKDFNRQLDEERGRTASGKDAITTLETENADLRKAMAAGASSGPLIDYRDAFRLGVKAYEVGDWKTAAQHMRDALRAQRSVREPAKKVQIYGLRVEPYAPQSYLGAALFESKPVDCNSVLEATRQADSESPPNAIKTKLQAARAQCGAPK